jgi:hypothetical protein
MLSTFLNTTTLRNMSLVPFPLKNLADLFVLLDRELDETEKQTLRTIKEESLHELHFGLNAYIRSLAFYRNPSPGGKEYFEQLGLPDGASGVLGDIYWKHVRGEALSREYILNSMERHCIFLTENEMQNICEELRRSYESIHPAG